MKPGHPWRPWCAICTLAVAERDPDLHRECLALDLERWCECKCPWLTEEDQ